VKDVAVSNAATVKDLKLAIRKKINEIEQEKMGHRHISWKHVWDNYCLTHHNEKLVDDSSALSSHGVRNNSKVCFSPHIMSRVHRKHSRRRKHRFFHGLSKKLWSHLVNLKLEKQAGAKAWWTSSFSHKNSVVTSELIGSWDVLQWFFSLTVRATPVLYFSRSQRNTQSTHVLNLKQVTL